MDIRNRSKGFNVIFCILCLIIFPLVISSIFLPQVKVAPSDPQTLTIVELAQLAFSGSDFDSWQVCYFLSFGAKVVTYILIIVFATIILAKAITLFARPERNSLFITSPLLKLAKTIIIQFAIYHSIVLLVFGNEFTFIPSTGEYLLFIAAGIALFLVLILYWSNKEFAKGINKVLSTFIVFLAIPMALFFFNRLIFVPNAEGYGDLSLLVIFLYNLFRGYYTSNWYYSFIIVLGVVHLFIAFVETLKILTSSLLTNDDDYTKREEQISERIKKQNYPLATLEHSIFLLVATVISVFILPLGYKYMFNQAYKINYIDYVFIGASLLIFIFAIINLATSPKEKINEDKEIDNTTIKENNDNHYIEHPQVQTKRKHDTSEILKEPEEY